MRNAFVLVLIAFMIVGGCGGGGDEHNGGTVSGPGSNESCQSPPLNTNFESNITFFVSDNGVVLCGLLSDSEVVAVACAAVGINPVALGGVVVSSTTANIILAGADINGDGFLSEFEVTGLASGNIVLINNRQRLRIDNLTVATTFFGLFFEGDCIDVNNNTRNLYLFDELSGILDDMMANTGDDINSRQNETDDEIIEEFNNY